MFADFVVWRVNMEWLGSADGRGWLQDNPEIATDVALAAFARIKDPNEDPFKPASTASRYYDSEDGRAQREEAQSILWSRLAKLPN